MALPIASVVTLLALALYGMYRLRIQTMKECFVKDSERIFWQNLNTYGLRVLWAETAKDRFIATCIPLNMYCDIDIFMGKSPRIEIDFCGRKSNWLLKEYELATAYLREELALLVQPHVNIQR